MGLIACLLVVICSYRSIVNTSYILIWKLDEVSQTLLWCLHVYMILIGKLEHILNTLLWVNLDHILLTHTSNIGEHEFSSTSEQICLQSLLDSCSTLARVRVIKKGPLPQRAGRVNKYWDTNTRVHTNRGWPRYFTPHVAAPEHEHIPSSCIG